MTGEVSTSGLRRIGLVLAVAIAVLALFSGHEQRSFDAYVHMFFADHYARDWFELWEPRWYGGFSVVTYPPLAHQTLALLTFVFGHERGYVVLTAILLVLIPLAVGAAARVFVDERSAALAVILTVLWPTTQRVAYVYGQLPTLFAVVLVLFAMRVLDRYIERGKLLDLATFGCLIGGVAGAHHMSMLFAAFCCVVVGLHHLFFRGDRFRTLVLRLAVAGALAAGAVIAVAWPFIRFASGEPQTEIPHFSRQSIFERGFNLELVEHLATMACALAATVALFVRRHRVTAILAVFVLGLFVLSLGATTPLPRIVFGSQWLWLPYDRFTFWGALLSAILFGAVLGARPVRERTLVAVTALLLPVTLYSVSHKESERLQPPHIKDLGPMLQVLTGPDAERYRHLTLGFGDQFCRLSILGRSPNADGDYHTARRSPLLRKSGIGTLDAAKYFTDGERILRQVLADKDAQSLRWVFVYDEWYYPMLFDSGFTIKELWPNGVTLFESDVPAISGPPPSQRGFVAVSWGSLPLAFLAAAIGSYFLAQRKNEAERKQGERRDTPENARS